MLFLNVICQIKNADLDLILKDSKDWCKTDIVCCYPVVWLQSFHFCNFVTKSIY